MSKKREELANAEFNRLYTLYKEAGADSTALEVCINLIKKVAELYATLETLKNLPTIIFDPSNILQQKETAAGKARVKYMAQYVSSMQKLNKLLLNGQELEDEDMAEFE